MANKISKKIIQENVEKFAPALKRLAENDSTQHKNADGQAGPACSTPDEALIEEIAKESIERWQKVPKGSLFSPVLLVATKWAIREYIRRSAGKEKT